MICSGTEKKIVGLDESEQEAEQEEMRADKSRGPITQGLWATKRLQISSLDKMLQTKLSLFFLVYNHKP